MAWFSINSSSPPHCLLLGSSYAGLSAALVLSRARRSVLVPGAQKPCNRFAFELYASLTPPWHHQARPLPAQLGYALTRLGLPRVDEQYQASVPVVLAAGDCYAPLHQLAAAIATLHLASAVLSQQLIFST